MTEIHGECRPPRAATRLLRLMKIYDQSYECAGDLEEEYRRIRKDSGQGPAVAWYWRQVLALFPRYLALTSFWWMVMAGSYLRSTFRNMRNNKWYASLNVLSLVLGLVCAQMIFLFVFDEMSYDRFHERGDRIFRVYSTTEYENGTMRIETGSYYPLSSIVAREVPAIESSARYYSGGGLNLSAGGNEGITCRMAYVDAGLWEIFSFPAARDGAEVTLPDRDSIVISRSVAERLFGTTDASGMTVRTSEGRDLTVTGVIENVPGNSSLSFDCAMSFRALFRSGVEPDHWGGNPFSTFVLLRRGADAVEVGRLVTEVVEAHKRFDGAEVGFSLQSLKSLHLHRPGGGGLIRVLVIFTIVAVAVLLIACINFINLNTARASTRIREVVMRKVLGAGKGDLVEQFIGESMLITVMALIVSVALISMLLPQINRILGKDLSLESLLSLPVAIGFVVITLVTGLASGIYPAMCLSEIRTSRTLKSGGRTTGGNARLRKVLVVTQFAVSIFMMTASLGVYRQLDYILNKDLGYDSDAVITVRASGTSRGDLEVLKSELLGRADILSVSSSMQHPVEIRSTVSNADWPGRGPDEKLIMNWDRVGYDYFKTFGMEIIEGRSFSREFPSDEQAAYILNEEAVRKMGVDSPLGMEFSVFGKRGTVVGIVRDFHFQPLYSEIKPFVFMLRPGVSSFLYTRVVSATPETIGSVLETCRSYDPDAEYQAMHFDDIMLRYVYTSEQQMKEMSYYFTGFAMLIACMGLLGLSAFLSEKRRKEICIRRVFGASASEVTLMFTREFALWVVLAWAIATPVVYLALRSFLSTYAFHFEPDALLFLVPGGSALILTLVTVGFYGLKTARTGPAEILRDE